MTVSQKNLYAEQQITSRLPELSISSSKRQP
jgi:hypothetical protein